MHWHGKIYSLSEQAPAVRWLASDGTASLLHKTLQHWVKEQTCICVCAARILLLLAHTYAHAAGHIFSKWQQYKNKKVNQPRWAQ